MSNIKENTDRLMASVREELEQFTSAHQEALEEIRGRKAEADELVGSISAKSIAGDYENSAAIEARAADWLRWASIGTLAVIVLIVIFTSAQSAAGDIEWRHILSRLGMAFALSIPAGYLARESAKHRQQQYQYQQSSLELRAISPYLASLPPEQQHELKVEIARKIFGGGRSAVATGELGLLDTNAIVLELIRQLDRARRA